MDKNPVLDKKPVGLGGKRYIIKARTPGAHEAVKRLYRSKLSRAQVRAIIDITEGNIVGLKWAPHDGTQNIWFTYKGHRYDLKIDGSVIRAAVKAGKQAMVPPNMVKRVKCQLCGTESPVPRYDVDARCPECGFALVKFRVVQRK